MKAARQQTLIATVAGALLFASLPSAHATDVSMLISANQAICGPLYFRQVQDLRLAAKAQEGERAFIRYVHFNRPFHQLTTDEALARARAATTTRCGVAIGLKQIDARNFPIMLAASSSE